MAARLKALLKTHRPSGTANENSEPKTSLSRSTSVSSSHTAGSGAPASPLTALNKYNQVTKGPAQDPSASTPARHSLHSARGSNNVQAVAKGPPHPTSSPLSTLPPQLNLSHQPGQPFFLFPQQGSINPNVQMSHQMNNNNNGYPHYPSNPLQNYHPNVVPQYQQPGMTGYPAHPQQQQQAGMQMYPPQTQHPVEVDGATPTNKTQLVVGIDFGTTFSGVGFAFISGPGRVEEKLITEWRGTGTETKSKIPTVLYYNSNQEVVGWGSAVQDALAHTGFPKPGVQKIEWFKLQLMGPKNSSDDHKNYIDIVNLPPLPAGKTAVEVAADFLHKLLEEAHSQLKKMLGAVYERERSHIKYYLTVPAIWDDAAKAATRNAAKKAGILDDENDNRLTLVSEPEAAALYCSANSVLDLEVNDAVLIVDCGGGTVDLISYVVEEMHPFSVSECTAGTGDSCGSTALNRNFSNILRARIRKMELPEGSKTANRVYSRCIVDFEHRIKPGFRNDGQKWAIDVGIESDFPDAGIEEGFMTFSNEEILQCFEPVVNRTLDLVRNQIIAVQSCNRNLKNILVVGGFGASEHLYQSIIQNMSPALKKAVIRPPDASATIVRGAVTAGIIERFMTHRIARRHYLMATLQPFKEGYHPEQFRVSSLDGRDRCKNTRQIFVAKGQKVKVGEPVKVSFFRQVAPGAPLTYEDVLYMCEEDACPEYITDSRIKELVTLTSDLSSKNLEKDFERMDTPQGPFYRVFFDIYLTLDGSEFRAELVCQGEVMGRCRAKFK